MNRHWLYTLLGFSLLLNVGVLGAVGYQTLHHDGPRIGNKHDHLAEYLQLTAAQRRQWQQKETKFLQEMRSDWGQVRIYRERMIRQIFSEQPDLTAIEAARAAISRIQEKQQRHVIAQLMEEQRILDPAQRKSLATLLLQQEPAGSLEERLHGH